jgi:hypothetical protein
MKNTLCRLAAAGLPNWMHPCLMPVQFLGEVARQSVSNCSSEATLEWRGVNRAERR